jgi:hypothetical protein
MSVAVLGTNVGQSQSITKKNVMAWLVPAIHVLTSKWPKKKPWMPGIKPGMTNRNGLRFADAPCSA